MIVHLWPNEIFDRSHPAAVPASLGPTQIRSDG
jgi:hypothetical protein